MNLNLKFFANRIKDQMKKFKKFETDIPKIDYLKFNEMSKYKFNIYEKAFIELKEYDNNIGEIKRYKDEHLDENIELNFKDNSKYKLKFNTDEQLLYLISPETGIYKYYYNEDQEAFCNNKDNHLWDELLSRELLKITKGYLNI